MASEAVLIFLEEHNRPFSINEIQAGVKGDFGKSIIQKALDFLVGEEKVKEKVYGKQKVYCIIQVTDVSANGLREHLLEIDRSINELTAQLKEVSDKIKSNGPIVSKIQDQLSLEETISMHNKLEAELESIQEQVNKYSGTEVVCPERKLAIEKDYEIYLSEYKKRKRIFMDILHAILENYPKTKRF